jgi:hypothetical protein
MSGTSLDFAPENTYTEVPSSTIFQDGNQAKESDDEEEDGAELEARFQGAQSTG